jgi:hypothetical protein
LRGIDGAGQPVPLNLLADRVFHVRRDQADALGVEGFVEVLEHVGGRGVDVGDRLGRHHDPHRGHQSRRGEHTQHTTPASFGAGSAPRHHPKRVIQNTDRVRFQFLFWTFTWPMWRTPS